MTENLEQIIRAHVSFRHRANSQRWHPVLCKVCNDHGRKGPRAGFAFNDTGVGYQCFNCGKKASFSYIDHNPISQNMIDVLTAFNISEIDWQRAIANKLTNKPATSSSSQSPVVKIEPQQLSIPSYFYKLDKRNDDPWTELAIYYLEDRKIDINNYQFYLVNKTDHPDSKRWYGRLIIPFYKDNKLIYWQGRDLTNKQQRKYLNVNTDRNCVLSDFSQLFEKTSNPLFVTEGWFDAFPINGVAIFGNQLSKQQILWLNKSNRQKVIIPDKFGDGDVLARQALSLGWSVSTPDIGSCKDINEAIIKYGKLYTLKTITENIHSGIVATANVSIYCKNK